MMAMYHNIPELEAALNTATDELGLPCNFLTLVARMNFLRQNAKVVYNLKSCQCSPDKRYDTFDAGKGTVCSWSVLVSLLTGLIDPRASLNAFAKSSVVCHTPYGPNIDLFNAFTDYTQVRSNSNYIYLLLTHCIYLLDQSQNSQ